VEISEIKKNLLNGIPVYWGNTSYVLKIENDQVWCDCSSNNHRVPATKDFVDFSECFIIPK